MFARPLVHLAPFPPACYTSRTRTSQTQVGPYGTVPNNGTYKPPTVGGGSSGSASGTGSVTRTVTGTGSLPTQSPGDGAAGLKVGVVAAFMGVAAMFL